MKNLLVVFRLIFCLLSFCKIEFGLAQTTPALEQKISIAFSNENIEAALNKIGKQQNLKFSYPTGIFSAQKRITSNFQNKSLREVLSTILGPNVNIKNKGNYIILTGKKITENKIVSNNYFINGYITDAISGNNIPAVSLYDSVDLQSTQSNQFGYYRFNRGKQKQLGIIVNKENYRDTVIYISDQPEGMINIVMYPRINENNNDTLASIENFPLKESTPLLAIVAGNEQQNNFRNIKDPLYRNFQVSFLPYLGTNHRLSGSVSNKYSFNLLGGLSRSTSKMEVSGFLNVDREDVKFLQLAGFGNIVGGKSLGLQSAGFFNINGHGFEGVQLAGFINTNGRSASGVGLAGFINIQDQNFKGLQGAGFMNINADTLNGYQAAGFLNINGKDLKGLQAAGFLNINGGNLKGAQLSGFGNVNGGKIIGVQAAGFFNVANKVKGTQIGFINIADSLEGVALGFFSFVKSGYHRLEIAGESDSQLSLSFRSGTKGFYNILSAGLLKPTVVNRNENLFTLGYGFGTSFQLGNKFQITLDVLSQQVTNEGLVNSLQMLNKLNLNLDYFIGKKFSVFVGPQLTYALLDMDDETIYPQLIALMPEIIYAQKNFGAINLHQRWSLGFKAGLRFF